MGAKRFQCRYCGIKKDCPVHYPVKDDVLSVLASESKHMCRRCYKADKLLRDAEGEGPSAQPAAATTGALGQNNQDAPLPRSVHVPPRALCTVSAEVATQPSSFPLRRGERGSHHERG